MPSSFILVLDDCHLLKNPLILRLLTFLIERQPPQMHLIMLTREDLLLPVSRLRVRRQLVEIRQADLQFTSQEAEDFLYTGMGVTRLTAEDILALGTAHGRLDRRLAARGAFLEIQSGPIPVSSIPLLAVIVIYWITCWKKSLPTSRRKPDLFAFYLYPGPVLRAVVRRGSGRISAQRQRPSRRPFAAHAGTIGTRQPVSHPAG